MKKIVSLIVIALPFYAVPVHASPELAAKSKCMSCHQVDKKMLGPSFKDIAAKYKGEKDAQAVLVDSTLHGVKNKWGKIPMPPQKSVDPADAEKLAAWILSL
ncbi:MAG: cytochrome C [Betaproteobacteria bacterium HGW-Betaproteobacteria-17]|nr:MAG: cytochrome C [Betaproteobacteria bacterium HGW-Betaproteobacteria-17]